MTQGKLSTKQMVLVGITLFSMFFGAGNLILPPLLGAQAGTESLPAILGFFITGVGLPVLGIVAVALAGTARKLAARVHPLFAPVFVAAVYLAIGPCLAIPRTSSTAFEMLVPLLPEGMPVEGARLAFSVTFFAVAYVLAMHPGRLTKLLGHFTGPALIVLIVAVVAAALVNPPATVAAARSPYDSGAVVQGFLTGYQTMDLLASLTFGIVIADNIRKLGVEEPGRIAGYVVRAGVIAGTLMMLLYGGLTVVGVNLSVALPDVTNGAAVLTASATGHFGVAGTIVVAAIFLLACLNVCIGLISCCGEYFSEQIPAVSYRACALVFAAFSCMVSNFGLDAILAFSVPLLNALYPMAIALVFMGMFHRTFDRVGISWPLLVGLAGLTSIPMSIRDAIVPEVTLPVLDALPFAELGLAWVEPVACAALVCAGVAWARRRIE